MEFGLSVRRRGIIRGMRGAALDTLELTDHDAVNLVRGHDLLRKQPLPRVLSLVALQLDHLPRLLVLGDAAVGVD